jgi:hypothetical protein
MFTALTEQEWENLFTLLPNGWENQAKDSGAFQRGRVIRSPEMLLRLLLVHVSGSSLRQTVAHARASGMPRVSDVALLKRLRKPSDWLGFLAMKALRYTTPVGRGEQPTWQRSPAEQRIRFLFLDDFELRETGTKGTTWKLQFAFEHEQLKCTQLSVEDTKRGQPWLSLVGHKDDVFLAESNYASPLRIAALVAGGSHVVVRLSDPLFPLVFATNSGTILENLRELQGYEPLAWQVRIPTAAGDIYGKLCAVRKHPQATKSEQARRYRLAERSGKIVSKQELEAAGYLYVFTSLCSTSASEVLAWYRWRWEMQPLFKQLKTQLASGYVPKYEPESARAWIHAKLLIVALDHLRKSQPSHSGDNEFPLFLRR